MSALLLAISRDNVEPRVTEEDITGGCIMQAQPANEPLGMLSE